MRTNGLWNTSRTALLMLVTLIAGFAFGQNANTGEIKGTVTDPSGAVVPGANVTLTKTGTGTVRTTISDGEGRYVISNLQPGPYSVKVELSGFTPKTAELVLNVGGMEMEKALPEVDQINYLPRITQPVLMLNGTYDMYFPVESSQKPMFRLLGTPQAQKKMLVYSSGHLVPPTEFIKETLAWLDTYLGPTQ